MIERCQEGFQVPAMGQYSVNQAAAGGHYLARNLDKTHQETFEFHPQDIATCRGFQSDQTIPGLQIPGQGRNEHIGPVRNQAVRWHPQRVDPALELTDDVLLVAAVIGEENNLLGSHLMVVRYIKEVPHIIEQSVLALFDSEIFPNDDHPIRFAAMGGAVIEFSDLFASEADVFELSFFDHPLLNVFRTLPLFGFNLVARRPLERLPEALGQGIGHLDEVSLGIITKDESRPLVPAVEVVSEREIGVAPEPYLLKHRRCEFYGPIHPLGSSIVGGSTAGPVHEIEHLVAVGQSHDQRRVSPDSVVGNIHPLLAFARCPGNGPVDIDDGLLAERRVLQRPDFRSDFVDRFLQGKNPGLIEPTQKISGRGRIRDPFGIQCVHVGFVVAQSFDVFKGV
jgi:hypothetical protein